MKFRTLLANFSITALLLFASLHSSAQLKKNLDYSGFFDSYYYHQKYSFVAGVNIPFYFGDLCSSFGCTTINPGFTIGGGIKLWPRVYFGGEFSYFKMAASDEPDGRQFSFSSNNYELLALGRYYFIEDIVRKHHDLKSKPKKFKPYGTLGIGLNYANPSATGIINDTLYDLNDFEEQSYPKFILAIPVGLGIQYDITKRVHVIAEGLYRFTLSDYVDGVSKTASPNAKDAYMTFNLKVQYNPFAKRMKRKRKKIDPETINIGSAASPDSTSKSGDPLENVTPRTEEDNTDSEYQEGGEDDYNEGGDADIPTEEEVEEAIEEQYDEDGYLIEPAEEDSEEETTDDYDDGW